MSGKSGFPVLCAALCFVLSTVQASAAVPTPAPSSGRALGRVCSKISPFPWRFLYKYQASGHLQQSDRARSCSLIAGRGAFAYPRVRLLNIYDNRGKILGTFVNYAMGGSVYAARWYTAGGGPSCSSIAATAYRRTRSYSAYILAGRGVCWKVKDLRKRQGSVF